MGLFNSTIISQIFSVVRFCNKKEDIFVLLDFLSEMCVYIQDNDQVSSTEFSLFIESKINAFKNPIIYTEKNARFDIRACVSSINILEEHFLKIREIVPIILDSIKYLKSLVNDNQIEQFQDAADSIHCLADVRVSDKWDPNAFWDVYILSYQNKWDSDFLKKYQSYFIKNDRNKKSVKKAFRFKFFERFWKA